jgi:hypothetical protein
MSDQFATDVFGENIRLDEKIKLFDKILKDINNLDEKKRALWIDIYTNAIVDRQSAFANYTQIVSICADKSSEWAVHGRTVTATLERMQKATEQLIKLAVLVENAQEKSNSPKEKDLTPDDIFKKIGNGN